MAQLMQATYPTKDWLPWKFGEPRAGFWEDKYVQRKWLEQELKINNITDWYSVPLTQIISVGGSKILQWYHVKVIDCLCYL
jgi:hypothetical protein